MKKIITIIVAIAAMMTLASCEGKSNVETEVVSMTIEEMRIPEKTIEENIIEETICYTYVELEGKSFTNVEMTRSEMDDLLNAYDDGKVSKEYAWEVLFNSQS